MLTDAKNISIIPSAPTVNVVDSRADFDVQKTLIGDDTVGGRVGAHGGVVRKLGGPS